MDQIFGVLLTTIDQLFWHRLRPEVIHLSLVLAKWKRTV